MNEKSCTEIREMILEAELDELRGMSDSRVARHVVTCAECQAYAHRLLRAYHQMDAGLSNISAPTADAAVIPLKRRRRALWLPLPLAAAAVIALVMARAQQDDEMPNVDRLAQLMFNEEPVVSPRAGQQAMVMEKKDMTIVWLYKQETP
jgi:anti-sigma factor RsiW